MGRWKTPPDGFVCPYRDNCPHLEGLSAFWMFHDRDRSRAREHEHWLVREKMADENSQLRRALAEEKLSVERLKAENKLLHQRRFKASKPKKTPAETSGNDTSPALPSKPRGAPKGHLPWRRKVPDRIDRHIQIEAPCICPHCQGATDQSQGEERSYTQEDTVWEPRTLVTSYQHSSAYCPKCDRQVIKLLEGELPFAPIGPHAKAVALYLRHALKLPYRKINAAMKTLFGLDFVPASTLGFEKRARKNADPVYADLILKMRSSSLVHADETHWREDGQNCFLWYAGNGSVAVFRIDPHRSSAAAIALLGEKLDALLITDAYAAYNAIGVKGRQSCLAHLLRKSRELAEELTAMSQTDHASLRFCNQLSKFFKDVCKAIVPAGKSARQLLISKFQTRLATICKTPPAFPKAETLRQRLLPTSREYAQLFAFILNDGPPTNNHAERSLRPLVIFRKICMGTRSETGSENISVFGSLTQTIALQSARYIDMFRALFTQSPNDAQDAIFGPAP
jgi:transposase